jgi:hypothetical protein
MSDSWGGNRIGGCRDDACAADGLARGGSRPAPGGGQALHPSARPAVFHSRHRHRLQLVSWHRHIHRCPSSQSQRVFGLNWRRAPAHTAIRYILRGLDPKAVEAVFRRHAAALQAARSGGQQASIALDGKTLRGSFDNFNDRAAAQVLSALATDTALVLAHVDIAEKSNEIPAVQALLAELGVTCHLVTLDALHCQKNIPARR